MAWSKSISWFLWMKSGVRVEIKKDITPDLIKALKRISQEEVLVGIPEDKSKRKQGEVGNATLGAVHDKGSPANNIPPRPFMDPGIQSVKKEIDNQYKNAALRIMSSGSVNIKSYLIAIGLIAQKGIRNFITAGEFTPLKPETIKRREQKGIKSTKPLTVTGQLRNAINFVLRRRK